MIFFYCWYVSEFSHLLAMLLLLIISVYLEKKHLYYSIILNYMSVWITVQSVSEGLSDDVSSSRFENVMSAC